MARFSQRSTASAAACIRRHTQYQVTSSDATHTNGNGTYHNFSA